MPESNLTQVKQPHEIEMERKQALLAKVRAGRDARAQQIAKVRHKDPGKQLDPKKFYIWANRNEQRLAMFTVQGYTICTDPDVMSQWRREDGTHVYGDTILMEIDRELREMMKLDSQLRAIEGVEGEQVFAAFAERAGIPIEMPKS